MDPATSCTGSQAAPPPDYDVERAPTVAAIHNETLTTASANDPPPYALPLAPLPRQPSPVLPFSTLTRIATLPTYTNGSSRPDRPEQEGAALSSTRNIRGGGGPSRALPPPAYSEVPQTLAERCFVFGFLCPLVWVVGMTKYWYSERPDGFDAATSSLETDATKDLEAQRENPTTRIDDTRRFVSMNDWEREQEQERRRQSLDAWRQEEKLWSMRCAWSLGAFVSVTLLAAIVIAAVIGKL